MVSNVARRVNAEEPESCRKHLTEELAQLQACRADGRLALENRRALVEARIELRRLEEVVREDARLVRLCRAHDRARELQELQRKPLLGGSGNGEADILGHGFGSARATVRSTPRLLEKRADAGVGVL